MTKWETTVREEEIEGLGNVTFSFSSPAVPHSADRFDGAARADEIEPLPISSNPVEQDAWFGRKLRQLRELKAEQQRNADTCAREIDRITNWRDEQNAVLQRQVQWIEQSLHSAALGYEFPNGKKSRSLPDGKIGFRTQPAKVEIEVVDEEAMLAFAKLEGIPLKVKESVNKSDLRAYIESTDNVPAGCSILRVPPVEKFVVEVA